VSEGKNQWIQEELAQWSKGVLSQNPPAKKREVDALQESFGYPLPEDYRALLRACNGADFRLERLFSSTEAAKERDSLRLLLAPTYRHDPDWPFSSAPDHLLPIAVDREGNLKCIDASTQPPEIIDWHRASNTMVTWHPSVTSWALTCLQTLAMHFDYRGRPRPIRGTEASQRQLLEVQVHLKHHPEGSYPRLEEAHWYAENGTPEEALFAYRRAAEGTPEQARAHYLHARCALHSGREAEARRALRHCLAVPVCPKNPRKNDVRVGIRACAQTLLGLLYERIGQHRKALEQRRLSEKNRQRYGGEWYSQTEEFQTMIRLLTEGDEG
jgi:hypothetical protein